MPVDLHTLPLAEWEKLQKDIPSAISSFEARKKAAAHAAFDKTARELGFVLHDLIGTKAVRKPSAPVFTNSANKLETRSGRGRRP